MEKIKVRVYPKNSNGQSGVYENKTAQFLKKAAYGTEVKNVLLQIDDYILQELSANSDEDSIAAKVQNKFGLDYFAALDRVSDIKSAYQYDEQEKEDESIEMIPDSKPYFDERNNTNFGSRYNYPTMAEESMALDEEVFPWDSQEQADNSNFETLSEDQLPMVKKAGGSIPKHKFIKKIVKDLKKAAEGTEQEEEGNEATTNDIPVDGRNQRFADFIGGMKNLGNEYYAKQIANQIYDQSKQLEQQQFGAAEGDTFPINMNQTQQVGEDGIPEARYGRRMARKAARYWDKTFGKVPIGMFGPGVPNYFGYITPRDAMNISQMDPRQMYPSGMDVSFTKRPFRKRLEIRNVPFYMPNMQMMPNQIPYTYPGEIYTRDVPTEEKNPTVGQKRRDWEKSQGIKSDPRPRNGDILYYYDATWDGTKWVEPKAFGGPIMNPQPNQYGQLQRFVGGGDEMPTPAYSAYTENDVNTKDITDPYYKHGGLHKYQRDGQVNELTAEELELAKKYGINDPKFDAAATRKAIAEAKRNEWIDSQMSGNQTGGGFKPITSQAELDAYLANYQRQQQQQFGMPYSNDPLGSFLQSFKLFKPNPRTGQNYDFHWLSQTGPITKDGQPWQPNQGQGTQQLQGYTAPQGDYNVSIRDVDNTDAANPIPNTEMFVSESTAAEFDKQRKLNPNLTVKEFLGQSSNSGFPQMEMDPTKAGYRPSFSIGKKSGEMTWNWYDPANLQQNQGNTGTNQNVNLSTDPKKANDFTVKGMSVTNEKDGKYYGTKNGKLVSSETKPSRFQDWRLNRQLEKENQKSQAYGGVPHFHGLDESQINFDPNDNKLAIDPNNKGSFKIPFKIHKARTLDLSAVNRLKNVALHGVKSGFDASEQRYNDAYLAANTTSDNRVPANELVFRGRDSGLTQRKQEGYGKHGGAIKYKKGGIYDLNKEEIGAILAAGGQIKFI